MDFPKSWVMEKNPWVMRKIPWVMGKSLSFPKNTKIFQGILLIGDVFECAKKIQKNQFSEILSFSKLSWVMTKNPRVMANFGLELLKKNPWVIWKYVKKTL